MTFLPRSPDRGTQPGKACPRYPSAPWPLMIQHGKRTPGRLDHPGQGTTGGKTMFDAKALLNSVLGADAAAAVSNAWQNAAAAASDAADKAQAQLQGTKAGDVFAQGRQLAVENPG